jgi:hypothetical protein
MITIPMPIIREILSYFDKDIYQDKKGRAVIFARGVYDNLAYLFAEQIHYLVTVSIEAIYDVEESIWKYDKIVYTDKRVQRPNAITNITTTTCNGVPSQHSSLVYSFRIRHSNISKKYSEHKVGRDTYRFCNGFEFNLI